MIKRSTILISVVVILIACSSTAKLNSGEPVVEVNVADVLKSTVMKQASWALSQQPITVTATHSNRSAGGPHDFFSEGDYWWPNPVNADSPYIQKDGLTNPENFVAHRQAMIRFSRIVGALISAYKLTGDRKYVIHALKHCDAWFTDTSTMMTPHLLYAQAIKGRFTGRGIGIIDTIQLIEIVQALLYLEKAGAIPGEELVDIRKWFGQYISWLTTHKYGKDEMNALNNHGTCWVMQVAAFAKFTGNSQVINFCRQRFKEVLLPNQMGDDGSFPREMQRTKPYSYSLFNLDAMATICQILSTPQDDLWNYTTAKGQSVKKGIEYLYPYIVDKRSWPLKPDIMYWNDWPVAHPFLLFGGTAYNNKGWLKTWMKLDHDPGVDEVLRNLPVRNPLLWL